MLKLTLTLSANEVYVQYVLMIHHLFVVFSIKNNNFNRIKKTIKMYFSVVKSIFFHCQTFLRFKHTYTFSSYSSYQLVTKYHELYTKYSLINIKYSIKVG